MKFQNLAPSFMDHKSSSSSSSSSSSNSSLTFSFKRVRPSKSITHIDLKTLTTPKPTQLQINQDISPLGGTRWNPTQEQIRMLEALYRGGLRTPNAEQIDRIAEELGKHGRIEGKNVFYWFQNHKARERQRQKRNTSSFGFCGSPSDPIALLFSDYKAEKEARERSDGDGSCKRKCRSWNGGEVDLEEDGNGDGTLELFPLRPERGR